MRVHIVDPTANTPPYDHALCGALARAGAEVDLVTSPFPHGPVPQPNGYRLSESFHRLAARVPPSSTRLRRAGRLIQHVPDMLSYRSRAQAADIVHFQWLPFASLDRHLLPDRPRVLTVHNVDPRRLPLGLFKVTPELVREMDAIVVHSRHGLDEFAAELGVERERFRVIPHGAFQYLTELKEERPLPDELQGVESPVVLFFGLLRDYKGVDVLLEAFREVEGAELWLVGENWLPEDRLRALAARCPGTVRFVDRWITDPEIPAYLRRADLVVLPFRQMAPSGVLHVALAFGKPLVLSSLGGFVDVAEEHGAARLVPPEQPRALAAAIRELLADPFERERLSTAAARAAREAYSWDAVAQRTLDLYGELAA